MHTWRSVAGPRESFHPASPTIKHYLELFEHRFPSPPWKTNVPSGIPPTRCVAWANVSLARNGMVQTEIYTSGKNSNSYEKLYLLTNNTFILASCFSDPMFNGMVVLTCSNARNPCTIKFHQACWKLKKDQLSALKKLSDKVGRGVLFHCKLVRWLSIIDLSSISFI